MERDNVNIKNFTIGNTEIDLQMADIILINGGSDNGQEVISKHILNQRKYWKNLLNFNFK